MQKVMIVGAGKGGTAILQILLETDILSVAAVIDVDKNAPGIQLASCRGILTATDWTVLLDDTYDLVIDVTGSKDVFLKLRAAAGKKTALIPGSVAFIIAKLLEEKEALIGRLQAESVKWDLIFNSTDDGMIVVDDQEKIIFFNKSAERMTGFKKAEAIGKNIKKVIVTSRLPHVMRKKRIEANQEQVLANGMKIITTRIPMLGEHGEVYGAFAVFKDITQVVDLAEEITNLKEIQTMLQAIIQSSDDAISVVDELGHGILINPAYTRITGLTEEEVIGKPATTDIYEGESMHMQVLQTRRPVRGTNMRVGPAKREVIVNVAPIIVDGRLKGSVGVIHDMSEIQQLNQELNRARQIIRTLEAKYSFEDIIGISDEMALAIDQARLSAKTPATVLLRGESGTGKELFAHAIHNHSDRKFNKFVRVNCAALSESLLESELFGYEEGAFSGAKRGGKRGLFEEANNGSIFLDEIGELTPSTQAKLLRVLQENEILRVGGTKALPINVRVIAATNVNLEKAIVSGSFREDLYFRLNRMPIHISPLRKRREDIPALSEHLIQKLNQEYGRNIEGITTVALQKLMMYQWPGNVRELENILGRSIIFMKLSETMIDDKHLPEFLQDNEQEVESGKNQPVNKNGSGGKSLSLMMDNYERSIIKQTMEEHKGNKTAASRSLGISVRNLYYKLEKYNLEQIGMQ
ncbi:sigma-54-dependent Fis family transcriptional regulator [Bacillus sp. M6-12]|uniref:sigma 54-interacting transcriptional regulator n=1 Tax=Bacillus sp. M6-12 TaxID=2054166 RepID=UPI000C7803AE|nr:sigma 54-interacting transcriptional regulator [Bacillus sp. M6-12]PLS15320.1 sigma-54-dependent Fis family transcriptional regulator [Bacillus sp. M6-12]